MLVMMDMKCFRCSVSNIPTISVVQKNGKWFTADNRRLWVFRQLERLGKCDKVFVQKGYHIPESKLTTENGGLTVQLRGSPGGYWHRKASATKQRTNTSISSSHNIYRLNTPVKSTQNVVTKTYQSSSYNKQPASGPHNSEFTAPTDMGINDYRRTTRQQRNTQNGDSYDLIPEQHDYRHNTYGHDTYDRPKAAYKQFDDVSSKYRIENEGCCIII